MRRGDGADDDEELDASGDVCDVGVFSQELHYFRL